MISALGLAGWILLLTVPPLIVLLYFLKLRRRPVEVPSTYLWRKTIEDMHVNSLWQRLRNNLLMYLQVLAVLLIALACLRPGCPGEKLSGDRFVFLIDTSASMSATDVADGSRLDEAKRQVQVMIDRMKAGDTAMVIAFSNRAEVVQSYTNNLTLLRQKVNAIEQTERSTDLREALVAAAGLANPGRTATDAGDVQIAEGKPAALLVFSDGGFADVNDFSLGNLTPEYHAIGAFEQPYNVGITAFAINNDPNFMERQEAFAQIQNTSLEDCTVDVTLYVANEIFDAQENILVPAGRSTGISFPLAGLFKNLDRATRVELVLKPEDVCAQDNRAFAVVNPPRPAQILVVTPGNDYIRLAMDTEAVDRVADVAFEPRSYLESPEYLKKSIDGEYDLIVFDQCTPKEMPNCNTCFIGVAPPGDRWQLGAKQSPSPIVDFFRSHPLMSSLQLTNVTIIDSQAIEGPPGMQSLLDSVEGTIMAIAPRGGLQDLVMSFPLATLTDEGTVVNTDWPSKLSFPLFIQNLVTHMSGGTALLTQASLSPGEIARIRQPQTISRLQIDSPDARQFEVARDRSDAFVFSQTEKTGIYNATPSEYAGEDQPLPQLFAVNLFHPQEFNLAVRESLEIGYEKVGAETEVLPARTEYWKYVLLFALVVLLVEWFIYNRRVLI